MLWKTYQPCGTSFPRKREPPHYKNAMLLLPSFPDLFSPSFRQRSGNTKCSSRQLKDIVNEIISLLWKHITLAVRHSRESGEPPHYKNAMLLLPSFPAPSGKHQVFIGQLKRRNERYNPMLWKTYQPCGTSFPRKREPPPL